MLEQTWASPLKTGGAGGLSVGIECARWSSGLTSPAVGQNVHRVRGAEPARSSAQGTQRPERCEWLWGSECNLPTQIPRDSLGAAPRLPHWVLIDIVG